MPVLAAADGQQFQRKWVPTAWRRRQLSLIVADHSLDAGRTTRSLRALSGL